MGGYFLALIILSILGFAVSQCPTPSNLPTGCIYNCSELICSRSLLPTAVSRLGIDQCSDPLALTLTVKMLEVEITQEYSVGGPQQLSTCNDHGYIQLHSTFSRNATHLMISVMGVYEGDIAIDLIPSVTLPLTPHLCMCQSMDAVADSFSISIPFISIQYNCSRDPDCTSVTCVFPDFSDALVRLTFDPCTESILVFGVNQTSGQSGVVVFNQTEDQDFERGDIVLTVHMTLVKQNYSMEVSAAISVANFGREVQVLPANTVLLDRSSCGSDLMYYPGPPIPVSQCTEVMPPVTTEATPPVKTTSTTPHLSNCPSIMVPSSCQPLANCSGLTCDSHFTTAVLVVDKCSDPLTVDLTVTTLKSSDPFHRGRYYVGGPERTSQHDPVSGLSVYYNRNSTHLNFTVMGVFEGDIADLSIPDVEFSLDPHTCSCQTLSAIASQVFLPSPTGAPLSCTIDQTCSSIDCAATSNSLINVVVHPCDEVLILTGGPTDQVVFNQSESRPFVEGGTSATANITLVNHNYSMEFKLDLLIQGIPVPIHLVPRSQVSLDRSNCDVSSLKYYPGDPPEPVIFISRDPFANPPPPVSITAIAVSIPLLFVVSLVIVVTVVVCVVVVLRRHKRTAVYSFRQLTDEEDKDDDAYA